LFAAKNNSDYIYYSKYNESGIESSSKNGSVKRKYTKKPLANPEQAAVKSAKSNSFHVPRILQKPVSANPMYHQSCGEDSSPSITSNSAGNMAISQADFSHDPHVKPFNQDSHSVNKSK
jgi:hypothetical protein